MLERSFRRSGARCPPRATGPFAVAILVLLLAAAAPSWSPLTAQDTEDTEDTGPPQAVRGHVIDDTNQRTVAGATVTLMTEGEERIRTVVTDSAGFFAIAVATPGQHRLEAQRFGYTTTVSQTFLVEARDTVSVDFFVSPHAVVLDPIVVTARSNSGESRFLRHMTEWGKGIFVTPAMVDSIGPLHWADIMRGQEDIWLSWRWGTLSDGTRGPRPYIKTFRGRGCMTYVVDGYPLRDGRSSYILNMIDPKDIVAVEIYRHPGEIPPDIRRHGSKTVDGGFTNPVTGTRFETTYDAMCGLAVYWTTADWW